MHALTYLGPGRRALEEKPKPLIQAATDAIVRVTARPSVEPTSIF